MWRFVSGRSGNVKSSILGNRVHLAILEWFGLVLTRARDVGANPVLDVTLADDGATGASSEREARGGPLVRRTQ